MTSKNKLRAAVNLLKIKVAIYELINENKEVTINNVSKASGVAYKIIFNNIDYKTMISNYSQIRKLQQFEKAKNIQEFEEVYYSAIMDSVDYSDFLVHKLKEYEYEYRMNAFDAYMAIKAVEPDFSI